MSRAQNRTKKFSQKYVSKSPMKATLLLVSLKMDARLSGDAPFCYDSTLWSQPQARADTNITST